MNHESHVKHERGEEAAHRDGSPYLGCWGRPGGYGFSRRLLIQQRPEYPNEDRLGASFEFTVVRRALFLDRIYRITGLKRISSRRAAKTAEERMDEPRNANCTKG